MTNRPVALAVLSAVLVLAGLALPAPAGDVPDPLPDPDGKPPAGDRPVKVYILLGQSNMVGMGDVTGGFRRWGKEFLDPVVSVYEGPYSPKADYDKLEPVKTMKPAKFGGVHPTPFPDGGTRVVRGRIRMETPGVYEFKPGYKDSSYNIMEIDGVEVYRREPGKEAVRKGFTFEAGKACPFRVIFLTDAAGGLGWLGRTDIPGTLATLVNQQGKFPYLVDANGRWTVRNDVIYKGVISAVAQGPLTVGMWGNTIGPELGFGHVMGVYHDEPVLLIKASIGNRSLGWDILPPGSERFTFEGWTYAGYKDTPARWVEGEPKKKVNWYAGKQYDDYVRAVHDVLDQFDTLFPAFKDQGCEIAGFVWWQGHKDGGDPAHVARYRQNLVRLIKSLRKEFKTPEAPFVLGTIAFGGREMEGPHLDIVKAQLAVSGETGEIPEFKNNVLTVEMRDFWRPAEKSPRNQGYHYNRNAETFLLVGEALGRGMVKLLNQRAKE